MLWSRSSRPPSPTSSPLHAALPICVGAVVSQTDQRAAHRVAVPAGLSEPAALGEAGGDHRFEAPGPLTDRKSTRLNSSHVSISYAVFCLTKKKNEYTVGHRGCGHAA